jgi:ATP-dependent Clp protease protease subunit
MPQKPTRKKQQTLYSFDVKQILTTHRQLFLYGEINSQTANHIKQHLLAYDIVANQPITMYISSPGGSCDDGLAIIEVMKHINSDVITVLSGAVASMASIIYVAGDKRISFQTSSWMQHPLSSWNADYFNFIKDRTKYLDKFNKLLNQIMKENTKLTPADYKKMETGELWLMGEELLSKGISDKII